MGRPGLSCASGSISRARGARDAGTGPGAAARTLAEEGPAGPIRAPTQKENDGAQRDPAPAPQGARRQQPPSRRLARLAAPADTQGAALGPAQEAGRAGRS